MARGFGGSKKGCDSCEMDEELPEFFAGKVVEKKVGKNRICGGSLAGPFEDFGADDGGQPVLVAQLIESRVGNRRLRIHQKEAAPPAPGGKGQGKDAGQKVSISGTEINQAGRGAGRILSTEPMKPQFFLAENRVETLKIPATGPCPGVGGGERIEDFRGHPAGIHELTSRRAP